MIDQYLIPAGAAIILGIGAYGTTKAMQVKSLRSQLQAEKVETARVTNALATCAARIDNIQEAAERNAAIPDDLVDFVVPDSWRLQPEGGADPAPD